MKSYILKDLGAHGKANGLKGFENIKKLWLDPSMFTLERDLLTPTFKLKRNIAAKLYKAQIDEMYNELKQ